MGKIGFDNEKYLKTQSEKINQRIAMFGGKLYLEFGGKLFDDYHASRVLPGFMPDSKIRMLMKLKDKAEIVIVINSEDIEHNKIRGDLGISYDMDVLRLIDTFRDKGLYVGSVVLTRFNSQSSAIKFEKKLISMGVKVYRHYSIEGYPSNVSKIVSDEGYGKNDYIVTDRSLVVVTAPGPGSGKMAVCLSQLYHEHKRGVKAGYAKFETFPIWNIPLKHPVNLAYEAATADLNDVNMIDPFHLDAYGETTVNYNRDIEIFPIVKTMLEKISGTSPYKSPTDMGVNTAGSCIIDDDACCAASNEEIIRRYFQASVAALQGKWGSEVSSKISLIMNSVGINETSRKAFVAASEKEDSTGLPASAIELCDGTVLTGKTSDLLGSASAMLLNSLKHLAGIDENVHLIPREIIEPIQKLKVGHLGNRNPRLHTDEVLIALSISAVHDDSAQKALEKLSELSGADMHSTVILSQVDENVLRNLGINFSCSPRYEQSRLYHN